MDQSGVLKIAQMVILQYYSFQMNYVCIYKTCFHRLMGVLGCCC